MIPHLLMPVVGLLKQSQRVITSALKNDRLVYEETFRRSLEDPCGFWEGLC